MNKFHALTKKVPEGWRYDEDSGKKYRKRLMAGDLRPLIERAANGRLRFNQLTSLMELSDRPIEEADLSLFYVALEEHGYAIGKQPTVDAMLSEARRHMFHPVVDYLDSIETSDQIAAADLDSALGQILGISEQLHLSMVRKTLIAAVARIHEPGCKVDSVLTLHSPEQGLKKSSFFKELAGAAFYTSSSAAGKDQILLIHSRWMLELAELDAITSSRDAGELKNVISTASDLVRVPYGRNIEPKDRQSILVATSNRADFLRDTTGSRRFWTVPITRTIDIEALCRQRDQIWKAAILAYRNREPWWFDRTTEALVQVTNEAYELEHPFATPLRDWTAKNPGPFRTADAIVGSGCRNSGQVQRADAMAASDVLRKLGYERRQSIHNGIRDRWWFPQQLHNLHNLTEEVVQLKPLAAQATEQPAQPAQPISKKSGEIGTEAETGEVTKQVAQVVEVVQSTAAQPVSAAQPLHNHQRAVHQPTRTNADWIASARVALAEAGAAITEESVTQWLRKRGAPSISSQRIAQVLTDPHRAKSPSLLE
jgi:predicted transcriptional regulator